MNKPKVPITGRDGNIFAIVARCSVELKRTGQRDKADEMKNRVFASHSYDEALAIVSEYADLY